LTLTSRCTGGDIQLGVLSTPGVPASRDRHSLRRLPDDAMFVNFSRAPWTVDHLGTAWTVPAGSPFIIDNEQPFRIAFNPSRRIRLYSLRIPRSTLGPTNRDTVRRADDALMSTESGRHLAAQMSLLAAMIDNGAVQTAALMTLVVVNLLRSLLHPADRATPTRLARLMDIARSRMTDPGFDLAALAREAHWSARTVQTAFSTEGLSFSDWLTGERLDLARTILTDPVQHASVAHVAHTAGFNDTSTFFRAYRRRFGATPGSVRRDPTH
jgi:AraC family transcriptional regulator, positive regulator of tynA and feaB